MSWAHLQSTGSQTATASTLAATYAGAVAVGSLLVATVNFQHGGATATIADTVNGAWTLAVGPTTNGTSGFRQYIFYLVNTAGGTPTVTATISQSVNFVKLMIGEYSGIATTAPLDQVNAATGNSASLNSGDVTTTMNNDLVYGAGLTSATDIAVAGGLTSRVSIGGFVNAGDKNATPAGVFSAAFTCTSNQWICQVATFKEPTVAFMPKSFQSQRMAVKRASFY